MKYKPILFSTAMVLAILDGRKSMTRRVIKPQPSAGIRRSVFVNSGVEDGHGREIKPRYQPSDILWVRETTYLYGKWVKNGLTKTGKQKYKFAWILSKPVIYAASDKPDYICTGKDEVGYFKRPSIFMPREAARIFLRATDARAQMLCNMTTIDFLNEGIELYKSDGRTEKSEIELEYEFEDLWDSLNKKRGYGWDTNPYVWVYEFERVEGMKC